MNPTGDTSPQSAIPPRTPPTHPVTDALGRSPAPSLVATPGRSVALHLVSLVVMAPWPLLGILLTHTHFDRDSEAFMLFGGITMFPLMILALFGTVSETVLIVVLLLVWLAAALLPGVWLRRRLRSRRAIVGLLGFQSAFSLAQTVMGALLILGKNV